MSSLLLIIVSNFDGINDKDEYCGRCWWEEEGWPEKLKEQTPLNLLTPCRHSPEMPGCYYCGTREDVARHTCQKFQE